MRRSTSEHSQASTTVPTPGAGRRRSVSFRRLGAAVAAMFARGPMAGPTTEQQLQEAASDAVSVYLGREDQYWPEKDLDESSEGQCSLMRSAATGHVFVVKHTKAVRLRDAGHFQAGDSKDWKFPNEVRILRDTLKPHRNIIGVLDVVDDELSPGRYYIWSEYCSGGDLWAQVDYWWRTRRAIVPEPFLLHVIISIANALAYAHWGLRARGGGKYTQDDNHTSIIHGDIKMENVFLRWSSREFGGMPDVVLGDWGCAKPINRKGSYLGIGTPEYGAPEDHAIHRNAPMTEATWKDYCKAVDVYGFGQVIYMLAAKDRRPWPIGASPGPLTISREYGTLGILQLAQSCLQVDHQQRAMANFDQELGLMPAINDIRKARNAMVAARRPLDNLEWLQKPKPAGSLR
ncbi:Serine/threonine-protein kinase Nek2 [Fulvia fulva]|nr:Serine/threonine-protein kinase Nek2 [Fulvia fulva]